jgi:hypothetical protein
MKIRVNSGNGVAGPGLLQPRLALLVFLVLGSLCVGSVDALDLEVEFDHDEHPANPATCRGFLPAPPDAASIVIPTPVE